MSRGLRNCNPGNIRRSKVRYKGEVEHSSDSSFKQFVSMAWGYRAIFVLLHTYRLRHSLTTVRQMIGRYAPPSENSTDDYVRFVASRSGIGADEPIDTLSGEPMKRIVAAISRVENGVEAVWEEVEDGWRLFVEQPV